MSSRDQMKYRARKNPNGKMRKALRKIEELGREERQEREQREQQERDLAWAKAWADNWIKIKVGVELRAEEKAREMAEDDDLDRLDVATVKSPPAPGDTVRFTAQRLATMYGLVQPKKCAPNARAASDARWLVIACPCSLCARGGFIAVEGGRHFACEAIERVDRAPAGPIDKPAYDAMLEQLGMRCDEDGRWFVARLAGEP